MRELYDRHSRSLLYFLTGLCNGDRMLAEDLCQETMMRAWRHPMSVPTEADAARRWLLTVGRRVAIDAHRRRGRRPAEVRMVDHGWTSTIDQIGSAVAARHLVESFRRLTSAHQEVLSEIYLQGRSTREVAARLSVPPGTVKSRAHNALRALRSAVEGEPG